MLAAALVTLLVAAGAGADIGLNPEFGDEGISRTSFTPSSLAPSSYGVGHLLLAAGPGGSEAAVGNGLLARFVDGRLDAGFGEAGFVKLPKPQGLTLAPSALSFDAEGRLVVIGTATDEAAPYAIFNAYMQTGVKPSLAFVARYIPTGQLDGSFGGGDGLLLSDFGLPKEGEAATAGAPDGALSAEGGVELVVGTYETVGCDLCHTSIGFVPHLLVVLSADGSVAKASKSGEPDLGPHLPSLPPSAEQVVGDPRGRIVVLGGQVYRHHRSIGRRIWRYHADGTRDRGFRKGSSLLRMRPGTDDSGLQLVPGSSGIFLVGTYRRPKGHPSGGRRGHAIRGLMVMRLRDDGGIDRGFGREGVSITHFGPKGKTYFEKAAALSPGGNLVVAGESIYPGSSNGQPAELVMVEFHGHR